MPELIDVRRVTVVAEEGIRNYPARGVRDPVAVYADDTFF